LGLKRIVCFSGGEAVRATEYTCFGRVTEFKYGAELSNAFRGNNPIRFLRNFGLSKTYYNFPVNIKFFIEFLKKTNRYGRLNISKYVSWFVKDINHCLSLWKNTYFLYFKKLYHVSKEKYPLFSKHLVLWHIRLFWKNSLGQPWAFLPHGDALVFVDNHDSQREIYTCGFQILTYREPRLYKVRHQ